MNEAMTDPGRFCATGVLDEDFLRRHVNVMLPQRTLTALGGMALVITAYTLWRWSSSGRNLYLAFTVLFVLIVIFRLLSLQRQVLRQNVNRLKESAPDGEMLLTTSCTE